MGFTGSVGFENYDGTPLGGATLANDSLTMTNLKSQQIWQFGITGAVDKSQIPIDLGNSLQNQGSRPAEGETMTITPAQAGSQLSSPPQKPQSSASTGGALQN
jgi:hypothetical protein